MCRWRLCGNTFSLLVRAFRAGRLSLISLSSGPRLSALSITSGRPSSAVPPPPPGHPAPPSSAPRVPPSRYHPAFIPPLNSPLKPHPPVFNHVKAINVGVNPRPPLPGGPPTPIKGEHQPRTSPHLSQPLFSSLHAQALLPPSAAASGSAPPSPGHHVAPPPRVRPSTEPWRAPHPSRAVAASFRRPGRPLGRAPASPCRRPLWSPRWNCGPVTPALVHEPRTGSMLFPLKNNYYFRLFQRSCKKVPRLLGNQPAVQVSQILHLGPSAFPKSTRSPKIYS
jgi:hypothetical protein